MNQDYSWQQRPYADFSGQNCENDIFRGADLSGANFTGANLRGANLRNARLTGAQLRADLSKAQLPLAQLGGADLHGADLSYANLRGAHLHGADLSGADLTGADLFGANLRSATLTGASLVGVDLSEADLSGANLSSVEIYEADLARANFREANLSSAKLVSSDLSGARFEGADLNDATFRGLIDFTDTDFTRAKLHRANLAGQQLLVTACFRGAELHQADFREANLKGAELRDAVLYQAQLKGCQLRFTDLRNADLQEVEGLRVDRTRTGQAIYSHGARDAWSILRRNYSGHRFTFALIFLIIFLMPYVARTLFWAGVSALEKYVIQHHEQLDKICDDAERDPDPQLQRWAGKLRERVRDLKEWLPRHFQQRPIAVVLLGWDQDWLHIILAGVLITFNLARGILVFHVSQMKDEEDRTGVSPPWYEPGWKWPPTWMILMPWKWKVPFQGYRPLLWLHYIASALFVVSLGCGLMLAVIWLSGLVWVPLPTP